MGFFIFLGVLVIIGGIGVFIKGKPHNQSRAYKRNEYPPYFEGRDASWIGIVMIIMGIVFIVMLIITNLALRNQEWP